MISFGAEWMINVALCFVSTLILMTSGHNILNDKKPTTLVERLRTSSQYADALKLVGNRNLAIHKANNHTVFFAPKVDTDPFGHFTDAESMARFFDSHTFQIPNIWKTNNEQIVYNTHGHKLRLNTYYNPKESDNVYTINGVIMGTVIVCSKDGSHLVKIQDGLLPATRSSVAKAASKVQCLRAFAQALEFTGLGAQIDHLKGPITVFAPTNTALETLPSVILDNPERLKNALKFNVVNGTRYSDGIFEGQIVKLNNKDALNIIDGESAFILHDMAIIELDIPLHNGVLQALDGIISVPDLPDIFRIND